VVDEGLRGCTIYVDLVTLLKTVIPQDPRSSDREISRADYGQAP
jgi:hypothetical protein